MNTYDKEYKALTLRLGFALLLMFVLLQGLMTVLGFGQMLFAPILSEKVGNLLYWGLYNVFYFASFMLPVPFFMLISRKQSTQKMALDVRFPRHFALMAVAAVGMIMAAGQINSLLVSPFVGENASTQVLLDLISGDKGYMVVLVFVMLVIVPPFCEEFLFRGLVLGNLLPYGKGMAIVSSALLFSLMHQSFSQFLYTAVAGVVLGLLYTESGSIWPSTLVHMVNNLLSFGQMILMARISDQMLANRIVICMNLLVIFAGCICMLILVLKAKKQPEQSEQSKPLGSMFGVTPDRASLAEPVVLSHGMSLRGLFTPSVAVFAALSMVMAVLNLIVENIA